MFILSMRFQLAALCFFVIIIYDYLKNKKLPLLSTKYFTSMMVFAGLYLCCDISTVYTITHMNEVTPFVNRLCHQLFITTILIMIISLYLYIEILGHNQKRISTLKLCLIMIPGFFTMVMVVFGELYYYVDETVFYSYGPMAVALYISIAFYLILIVVDTFLYAKNITRKKCMSIRVGAVIWILAAVVQFSNPQLLISGLAIILMVLFMYLSFENPKEYVDEDTGMFNKRAFHLMLTDRKESGNDVCIISAVVDNLNRIQNMVGHDNANLLLADVNHAMQKIFQDRIYHSRSNVMTVLVEKKSADLEVKMKELELLLKEAKSIAQYNIVLSAHIDVINTDFSKDTCDELYEMMNYMAEQNCKNENKCIYILDDDVVKEKTRYTTIEKMLHHAIEEDGFSVVYQPIFDVEESGYRSAEALLRLKDTTTVGFVSPEEFIRIAEKKGMIIEIGKIVFEKVCKFAKENQLDKLNIQYIEVNLSGIQCVHPDITGQLKCIMDKYEISPAFLNLEITETAAVESGELLYQNMQQLRTMGCNFSMDDFGTGYSNLSQMAEVVYDLVKLDKSLIWPCFYEKNKKSNVILENVIHMLLELNVKIVAEGVETQEMADILGKQGVTYLQGYFYSKPLQESDFVTFLGNNSICAI